MTRLESVAHRSKSHRFVQILVPGEYVVVEPFSVVGNVTVRKFGICSTVPDVKVTIIQVNCFQSRDVFFLRNEHLFIVPGPWYRDNYNVRFDSRVLFRLGQEEQLEAGFCTASVRYSDHGYRNGCGEYF